MNVNAMGTTVLFTGDSVTDCGRRLTATAPLGQGYVAMVAEQLAAEGECTHVINTGIRGNRSQDLAGRWDEDVLSHEPSVVSVLVGINDTWRKFDQDDPTSVQDYERSYRSMLTRTSAKGNISLVLVEPFLLPVLPGQQEWLKDLEPKIAVVRNLADEYGAVLLNAHELMSAAALQYGAAALAPDGVHPSPAGHRILAASWLEQMSRPRMS
jgi:acyl-CoA thioesterase I